LTHSGILPVSKEDGFMMPDNLLVHVFVVVVSFVMLTKSADFLVDGSVAIAARFNIPKMIIGIVLVGLLRQTAPGDPRCH